MRVDGHTYQSIARKAGVSRQYIQEVLSPPRAIRDYVVEKYHGRCNGCGIYVGSSGHIHHMGKEVVDYNNIGNLELLCIACHRGEHTEPPRFQCLYCEKPIKKPRFCDRECSKKYHMVTFICSWCGNPYSVSASQGRARIRRNSSGLMYCSKKCYGEWFGNNHGFGTRHLHSHKERKWDYEKIYQARDNTGFGGTRLSRLFGMPTSTCYNILNKRNKRVCLKSGGVRKRLLVAE